MSFSSKQALTRPLILWTTIFIKYFD